ncbi:MAG TPA: MoaD/ThiS family protein [Tepidisphaeraceae bacterium]|nr:MoaD/ThiS family protein [Tepidisphaeraceae bacterium]
MQVPVIIPSLLADCVGGTREVVVQADRLDEAIAEIQRTFPLLRPHIWDDIGQLRQHVLIFHNDTATKWLESLQVALQPGDRITFVQAVSGG